MRHLPAALLACLCVSGAALAAPKAEPKVTPTAAPPALAQLVTGFADFKTLHASAAELDAAFSPHCGKQRAMDDDQGVFFEFACKPESGMKSAMVTLRRLPGKAPFLMTLSVVFSNDYYPQFRKSLQDKLGKPKLVTADRAMWVYHGDKKLNQNGTPAIMITRDRDEKLTSFDVAIEQGP